MTTNITPAGSVAPVASVSRARAAATAPSGAVQNNAKEAVAVDTIPSSPPAEVHEAMGVAASAYERLQASGRELGFSVDSATNRVVVEVRDLQGNLLGTAPPSKALDVAGGGELD